MCDEVFLSFALRQSQLFFTGKSFLLTLWIKFIGFGPLVVKPLVKNPSIALLQFHALLSYPLLGLALFN